jgi:hypothetical protein
MAARYRSGSTVPISVGDGKSVRNTGLMCSGMNLNNQFDGVRRDADSWCG